MIKLNDIFKNTLYDYDLFSKEAVESIKNAVFIKKTKDVETPYIKCIIREKDIKFTPEEGGADIFLDCLCS